MPSGVYIRTEQSKKNMSKSRKKWIKENPEKSHELFAKLGRNLKNRWKNNRELLLKGCSNGGLIGGENLKKLWENNREKMLDNCSKTFKKLWKNNREVMLAGASKGAKIGGKLGDKKIKAKNIIKWMEENPKKYRESCSITGKLGGRAGRGIPKPNSGKGLAKWRKENPIKCKRICSKAGKKAWRNNREKLLEGCRKGGKVSIQKQLKAKPSYLELLVRKYLDNLKIKHRNNVWFPYNGSHKEADIVIPKYNLIIECDGWRHSTLEGKKNDKTKTRLFYKLGYDVLRLNGPEIKDSSFERKILNKINQIKVGT